MPGERIDGKLMLSDELASIPTHRKLTSYFDAHYYRGGEIKDMRAFERLLKEGRDKHTAIRILRKQGKIAKPGENRGFAEHRLYMRRVKQERDARFATALWRMLTWPKQLLGPLMEEVEKRYKQSVRQCAPGPERERINGRWQAAPMSSYDSILHISANPGTLKYPSRNIRLMFGPHWHKLFLNKGHIDQLRETYNWRMGKVRVNIGGETVEETFDNQLEGLPIDYVLKTYG